tara:strand:+ start:299 stop:538 length:240 start_codon:yes stop_codon:yes gene_type:complete
MGEKLMAKRKLKTVMITAVMETDYEYICNIPEDMSLEDFEEQYKENFEGGMWEHGQGGWRWGEAQELDFDKDAIKEEIE